MDSYLVGVAAIVILAVSWVAVQNAWRRAFPDAFSDPDVLAGRTGCHGCSCTDVCEQGQGGGARAAQEEGA